MDQERRSGESERRIENTLELHALREELAHTREAVEHLTAVVTTLASKDEVKAVDEKVTKKTRHLWIAIVGCLLALALVAAVVIVGYYLVQENRKTNEHIADCTTPTKDPQHPHICFEEGTQRTREAVGEIVDAVRQLSSK